MDRKSANYPFIFPRATAMCFRGTFALCIVVLLVGGLLAFEAVGTIQKVDAERGTVVIRVIGQDRTVKTDQNIKVLDKEGKELVDGLKSKELKEGFEATFAVELEKNGSSRPFALGKKETLGGPGKKFGGPQAVHRDDCQGQR